MARHIRRAMARLDTSNQAKLFAPSPVPARQPVPETSGVAVRFEEPNPRAIRINEVPLEELLKQNGQRAPLKLRELLTSLSFAQFESAYEPGGRPPYAPRAMIGVILSGIMQGITSLRELERYARVDLGCWWISGAIMPDHSIIGRFIQRHEALLTEGFFQELTQKVLKATGSGTAVVAGDGTIIEAAASRYRVMRQEALSEAIEAARIKQEQAPEEPKHAKRIEQLTQAQSTLTERQDKRAEKGKDTHIMSINSQDPEAVVMEQKNAKTWRAAYKPSVLANEERVIVACEVHPSSETAVVPALLDQAQAQGEVKTALFDAGYFASETLKETEERSIELLCPNGKSTAGEEWEKTGAELFHKNQFVYDSQTDSYRCPNGQTLTPVERFKGSTGRMAYAGYRTAACGSCPLIAQCTRSKQGRQIKRYACDAAKEALRARMKEPDVRARYKKRSAMVEPVFSQLRYVQGLTRFLRKGLKAVRVEFALHAMAYNLGRAIVRKLLICVVLMRRIPAELAAWRNRTPWTVPQCPPLTAS